MLHPKAIFLSLILISGCGSDKNNSGGGGASSVCLSNSSLPTCTLVLNDDPSAGSDSYLGFATTAYDILASDENSDEEVTTTVYGVELEDDANGNNEIDEGDTVKFCASSSTSARIIADADPVTVGFYYEAEDESLRLLWSGDCVDGEENKISEDE